MEHGLRTVEQLASLYVIHSSKYIVQSTSLNFITVIS